MRIVGVDGALDAATGELRAGRPVVVPTDTVYGVAVLGDDGDAVDELYRVKGRPDSVAIAVIVADRAQAEQCVVFGHRERALAGAFWPGALTIVAASRKVLAVGAGDGTLGVRCPDVAFLRQLAAEVGPLATTSANRHGEPTAPTAEEAARTLDIEGLLVVDGGHCDGRASTVVRIEPELAVLREGPVSFDEVARVVGGAAAGDP